MRRTTVKRDSSVPAGVFKATCLELMDRVAQERTSITITKRGKPIARLVPFGEDVPPLFGSMPVTILGDIVAPIGGEWDAERFSTRTRSSGSSPAWNCGQRPDVWCRKR